MQIEDAVPRHGLHATLVRLGSAQKIRVELRSADHSTRKGSAALRVARWPDATGQEPSAA